MRYRLMLSITGPVFLGSALLFALGAGAAWYLYQLQWNTSKQVAFDIAANRVASQLVINIRELRTHLNRFILTGLPRDLELIPATKDDVRGLADQMQEFLESPQETQLLRQLTANMARFSAEFSKAVQADKGDARTKQLTGLKDEVVTDGLLEPAEKLRQINQSEVDQVSERNEVLSRRMLIGLLILGVCGGLAGLIVGYGTARAISRSLFQLSVPIRSVAGKLDEVIGPITVKAGYSFEEINELLEQMTARVGEVVQRLQESRAQALRAEQLAAVGQLAAGLAHELRNPLTAVKILVQSAAERAQPGLRSPRDLAVLEEEIDRMEQLITTFLDFARPPLPRKQLLDVSREIEHVMEVIGPRAQRIGVHLDAPPPVQPMSVVADSMQLRQLLLNLTLNALDAVSPDGHVWISVDEECEESSGGSRPRRWLSIRVSDDGRGLPPELGQRIFDPFVSTKETGIGLGLSISKRIVDSHGGQIEAIDRPGGGAIFIVRMPLEPLATALPAEVPFEIPLD